MARARKKPLPVPNESQPTEQATASHHEQPAEHAPPLALADTERQAAHENGHAAHHTPHREHGSHAEAVGKRSDYSAAGIIDKLAGARFRKHQNPYLSIIKFEEKPSDEVRKMLADAGFQWNQPNKEWTRPIGYETAWQDRASAEDTFRDICTAVRAERGVTHGYGGPE